MTPRASVPILIVEDDAAMSRLTRHLLELEGYHAVHHAWTGEEALRMADEAEIILLDQQLPDTRGLDLLSRLLGRPNPPSVIMVTAHGSESLAATALRQGAADYLTKDHTLAELLPSTVERVRRMRALQEALEAAEAELVRTERLAAIGEVSVALHHELNNPLTAALAEVDLLLNETGLPTAVRTGLQTTREALLRIRESIRRATSLRQATAVDYLSGMRMVDLAPTAERPRAYRGRAVLQTDEPRLARVLALLLRGAGFQVERTTSMEDATDLATDPAVTLVVLGPDAGPRSGAGLPPRPERSFTLVRLRESQTEPAGTHVDLDLVLPFDPSTLVDEILAVGTAPTGPRPLPGPTDTPSRGAG